MIHHGERCRPSPNGRRAVLIYWINRFIPHLGHTISPCVEAIYITSSNILSKLDMMELHAGRENVLRRHDATNSLLHSQIQSITLMQKITVMRHRDAAQLDLYYMYHIKKFVST